MAVDHYTVDFTDGKLTVDLYRKRVVISVKYDDHNDAVEAFDTLNAMLKKGGAKVELSTIVDVVKPV